MIEGFFITCGMICCACITVMFVAAAYQICKEALSKDRYNG